MIRFVIISKKIYFKKDANGDICELYETGDYELIAHSDNIYHIREYIKSRPELKSDIENGSSKIVRVPFNTANEFDKWVMENGIWPHKATYDYTDYSIKILYSKNRKKHEFMTTYEFIDICTELRDCISDLRFYIKDYIVSIIRLCELSRYVITSEIDCCDTVRILKPILNELLTTILTTDGYRRYTNIDTIGFVSAIGGVEQAFDYLHITDDGLPF